MDISITSQCDSYFRETCYTIHGFRIWRFWFGRMKMVATGSLSLVQFHWEDGVKKDLIGFYHTHPGSADPSQTDVDTMKAWCFATGKPLLCVIGGAEETVCYYFKDDEIGYFEEPCKVFGSLMFAYVKG